jgi:CDP-diacylglycerol---glycerol-3-phosphate 3-phosphatidyltransferase
MRHRIWNIPNALSISRLPLGAGLFCAISYKEWWLGVLLMTIAALTDWADGWWARKFGPLSPIGRSLDPLTDKVLVCGAFIFLLPVPDAGLHAWIVESAGHVFPADWFGKVKMVLQCVSLIGILLLQAFRVQQLSYFTVDIVAFEKIVLMTLWLTVLVTIVSMLQYLWRAIRLMA